MLAATGDASVSQRGTRINDQAQPDGQIIAMALMVLAGLWWRQCQRTSHSGLWRKMTATKGAADRSSQSRSFDDRHFLFDREIPIRKEDLVEVGQQEDLTFYAETAEWSHTTGCSFLSLLPRKLARYLPEIPVGDDGSDSGECLPCPTTGIWRSPKRRGGLCLRRIGADVPLDGLASIASTAEGFTVYADATQQPPLDLLMDTGSDVVRFVLLDDEGRPPVLGETLQFQGAPIRVRG